LFTLIDETVGERVLGPYSLTADEAAKVEAILRAEIGKRPPLLPTPITTDATTEVAVPASIARRHALKWSDSQFSNLCQRHLGHPGLRSTDDDQAVHTAMLRDCGGTR
jgi:hypothetical protein